MKSKRMERPQMNKEQSADDPSDGSIRVKNMLFHFPTGYLML